MTILNSKIIRYKNINILKSETDKGYNIYSLNNNKNKLLNDVQFRKLEDCKRFINEILKRSVWNNEF